MTLAGASAALLTDRYQLTMAESYLAQGVADDRVAFELFVRELPADRGYLIAAGLEQAVDYMRNLAFTDADLRYLRDSGTCTALLCERLSGERFDADLDAVPEGTAVHAMEPLLRVEGRRLICQLVESMVLNLINFSTLVASKAARVVEAAQGRPAVDFGFRRVDTRRGQCRGGARSERFGFLVAAAVDQLVPLVQIANAFGQRAPAPRRPGRGLASCARQFDEVCVLPRTCKTGREPIGKHHIPVAACECG